MEILRFVFSDGWHFLGSLLLLFVATRWRPVHVHTLHRVNSNDTDNSRREIE